MTDNIWKYAAQNGLRFPSVRGELLAEQLFQLPLTHPSGFDLDTTAKMVNASLKSVSEESFVSVKADARKVPLEVSLEIVKDVISTKQAEAAARLKRAEKAEQRKKLLDAINAKQDQAMSASSLEELEKQLQALDDE